MSDKTSGKSIVPSGKTDLLASGAAGNRLIRRAASDALVPIQNMMDQMATTLHRVGTREFHEEDFRQLQVWASELGWDGQLSEFVKAIDKEFTELIDGRDELVLKFIENNSMQWCHDGRIRIFVRIGGDYLSFPRLPKLTHLCWFDELPSSTIDLSSVPDLTHLRCTYNQLTELDLASVPSLTELWCGNNQLTELDLASVPALTVLYCVNNQLTELDLASVPALTELYCYNNQLTELDLASVPALTKLRCDNNPLTELDLSSVPALTYLWCDNNQLAELDLSSVPALTQLRCYNNQLTELDLASVPALTVLYCYNNQLTELDLSSVPALTHLRCDNNQLTELDLAPVPALTELWCDNNQLTELDIRGCQYLKSVTVDPWVVVHKRPDQTVKHPK